MIHVINENSRSRVTPSKPVRKVLLTKASAKTQRLSDARLSQIRRRPYTKVRR